MLLNEANKDKISLNKLIELTSINPAKRFKIKNKGLIKENYDADLVILDVNLKKEVKREELYTKCGWSPFEGRLLMGWPIITIVNGNIVYNNGVIYEKIKGKEVMFY